MHRSRTATYDDGLPPRLGSMARLRLFVFAALAVAAGGCDLFSEVDPPVEEIVREPAAYVVTLEATWSAETHPDMFPASAHFSRLTGAAHAEGVALWAAGQPASLGIQDMAERGRTDPLRMEVEALGAVASYAEGEAVYTSPGTATIEVTVSDAHPLATVVSMLAPSPDWFIGVAGLDLRTADGWQDRVAVDLEVYDAGTDDGASYTAADAPRATLVPIGTVTYAPLAGTTVGRLVFERVE